MNDDEKRGYAASPERIDAVVQDEVNSKKENGDGGAKKIEVKKSTQIGFWLAIMLVIVAIAGVLFFILRDTETLPDAEETATEFIYLIRDGDYSTAYELTGAEFRDLISVEQLEEFTELHSVLYENKKLEFVKETVDSVQTILVGTITDSEGITAPVIIYIEQSAATGWRIKFFSINPADIPREIQILPQGDVLEDTVGEFGEEEGEGEETGGIE